MQATIAVIAQLGWHPVSPDKWMDAEKANLAELEWSPFANAGILEAMSNALEQAAWKAAAQHFLGAGLEAGCPNLSPAASAKQWLIKQDMFKEAKALDCIVCGGIWTEARKREAVHCAKCGSDNVSTYHRYWSCPALDKRTEEAVRSTQWMRKLFDKRYAHLECWWGRAILPAGLSAEPQRKTVDDVSTITTPGFAELMTTLRNAYTDGSGGPQWVPKSIKSMGSAVATLSLSNSPDKLTVRDVGISISAVPGRQTVPRAELWAAIMAAHAASIGQQIVLRIDAAYVVKGLQGGHRQAALRSGPNGDLWDALLELIAGKNLVVVAEKIKSHAEKQVLRGDMELEHFLGNMLADAGAEVSAEQAIDNNNARDTSYLEAITFLTAKRLAVIEAGLWEEGPVLVAAPPQRARVAPPTKREAKSMLVAQIAQQGHRIHVQGQFTVCSRCRRRRRTATNRFWTHSRCDGRRSSTDDDAVVAGADDDAVAAGAADDAVAAGADAVADAADADAAVAEAAVADAADAEAAAADAADADEHSGGAKEAEPEILVSVAKRRRLLQVQRAEERADREAADDIIAQVGIAVLQGLPWGIEDGSSGGQAAVGIVHSSHECITCGGFVGCNRCGSVISTSQHAALHEECRRWCPIGAQRPLRRLRLGQLPWGSAWPNGAVDPQPYRLRLPTWGTQAPGRRLRLRAAPVPLARWPNAAPSSHVSPEPPPPADVVPLDDAPAEPLAEPWLRTAPRGALDADPGPAGAQCLESAGLELGVRASHDGQSLLRGLSPSASRAGDSEPPVALLCCDDVLSVASQVLPVMQDPAAPGAPVLGVASANAALRDRVASALAAAGGAGGSRATPRAAFWPY